MNHYTYQFVSQCPVNGEDIVYTLAIQSEATVLVEDIKAVCKSMPRALHETLADTLAKKLGGRQKLTAHHHGVNVETWRGKIPRFSVHWSDKPGRHWSEVLP